MAGSGARSCSSCTRRGPLNGVFGAYYFEQDSDDIVTITLNPPVRRACRIATATITRSTTRAGPCSRSGPTGSSTTGSGVTVGGRYTEDKKGSYPDQFDYSAPNVKQVPVQWYRDTFSMFTPSGSVDFTFADQAMIYVSYSEGFKGGGWNSHFNSVPTAAAAWRRCRNSNRGSRRPTSSGFKLDLAGNTLRLNGAMFSTDYNDMQVTYRGPAAERRRAVPDQRRQGERGWR